MHQISESVFTTEQRMTPAVCGAGNGMRELACEEIDQVCGGLAFIPPVVVAVAKWGGAIAGGVFVTRAANDAYDWMFGDSELSCTM